MQSYTKPFRISLRPIVLGLLLLCLGILSGCCKPCLQTPPPPQHLLQQTLLPLFTGQTNEDLLYWALENRSALQTCNQDKQAIKEITDGTR